MNWVKQVSVYSCCASDHQFDLSNVALALPIEIKLLMGAIFMYLKVLKTRIRFLFRLEFRLTPLLPVYEILVL